MASDKRRLMVPGAHGWAYCNLELMDGLIASWAELGMAYPTMAHGLSMLCGFCTMVRGMAFFAYHLV